MLIFENFLKNLKIFLKNQRHCVMTHLSYIHAKKTMSMFFHKYTQLYIQTPHVYTGTH